MISRVSFTLLAFCIFISGAAGAGPGASSFSAKELAAHLSSIQQGSSWAHLLMQIKDASGATKTALQLQVKQRRSGSRADVLYQVLWPRERKGEAVLLHQEAGAAASGSLFLPPDTLRPLSSGQINGPLLGSNLSCQDVVEDFFAWPEQTLVGQEVVNRVDCVILESKPGGDGSPYGKVRSWIDTRRLVPMRIEKYLPSGELARRFDTTRAANDDEGRPIPANLTVRGGSSAAQTDLDGSRISHNVSFSDQDFGPEGVKDLGVRRSSGSN